MALRKEIARNTVGAGQCRLRKIGEGSALSVRSRLIVSHRECPGLFLFRQMPRQRKANWSEQSTKVVMERTIRVFEALVAADIEKRYHENWGQLGYALK